MLELYVNNETSQLKAVVLGTAKSCGPTPKAEDCYDPKSKQHVLAGTYPLEKNMPSINYIINNWPRSKSILKKFILSKHSAPDLFNICKLSLRELKVFREKKI